MRIRATAALIRSVFLALGFVVIAIFSGRVDLALLSIPFLVHVAWAFLRAPAARESQRPVTRPQSVRVREGNSVPLTVSVPTSIDAMDEDGEAPGDHADVPFSGWTSSVAFPRTVEMHTRPSYGALTDLVATPSTASGDGVAADERPSRASGTQDGVTIIVEPTRWGRYSIEPATVALSDPSGSWRATAPSTLVSLTVQPAATILQASSGVAHPIGVTGLHTSVARGEGSALADVREFRPGDRLTRINWRVTSRTGSLHVNSTLTDRDTDILIVVDTTLDVPPETTGDDRATSLDLTVRAVAAIAQQYTGFGDRIGLHDLDNRIGNLPAGTGPRQMRLVLDLLSRADRGPRRPTRIRPVTRVRPGTLVFFCSPLLGEQAVGELIRLHRLGAEVIAVDTLPESVGSLVSSASDDASPLPEAWAMRRLQREFALRRLESIGIPVTPWRGPASLAAVLLALEHARSAPRTRGGSGSLR